MRPDLSRTNEPSEFRGFSLVGSTLSTIWLSSAFAGQIGATEKTVRTVSNEIEARMRESICLRGDRRRSFCRRDWRIQASLGEDLAHKNIALMTKPRSRITNIHGVFPHRVDVLPPPEAYSIPVALSDSMTRPHGKRVVITMALAAYVVAHFGLSRVSAPKIADDWGIPRSFLYIPIRPDKVVDSRWLYGAHLALYYFFFPVWQIDHRFFGGPSPMSSLPLLQIGPPR
jgi:hypothetical protein